MKLPEYTITKINERFYRIRNYMVNLNLIIGDKKALLIDTGFGQSSILAFIQKHVDLQGKELLIANTHTHVDHCRGNFAFDTIYVHPQNVLADGSLEGYHAYPERDPKQDFKQRYNIEIEGTFPARSFEHIRYVPILEGASFDLGGVHIQVVETPGHTVSDLGFYWQEEKFLIVGDSFDTLIWTYFDNAGTQNQYLATVDKVLKMEVEAIYTGHSTKPRDKAFLKTLRQVLEAVNYKEATITPPGDLPRPGARACDFVVQMPVEEKMYQFKVQFHPTNFLQLKPNKG